MSAVASDRVAPGDTDDVVVLNTFLSAIAAEQTRFLGAIGRAACGLSSDHGPVAELAAEQTQLTRQFLDAQRALLSRRIETHLVASAIDRHAEGVAMHIAETSMPERSPASTPDLGSDARPGRQLREKLAAAVATPADPAAPLSWSDVGVDDVTLGEAMSRQLRAVLDQWWRAENRIDAATIDEADGRAEILLHLARIEAAPPLPDQRREPWPAPAAPAMATPSQPPFARASSGVDAPLAGAAATVTRTTAADIVDELDRADQNGLRSALIALIESLDTRIRAAGPTNGTSPSPASHAGDEDRDGDLGRPDRLDDASNSDGTPSSRSAAIVLGDRAGDQQHFDRFWRGATADADASDGGTPDSSRRRIAASVGPSLVGAMVAFGAVAAWLRW